MFRGSQFGKKVCKDKSKWDTNRFCRRKLRYAIRKYWNWTYKKKINLFSYKWISFDIETWYWNSGNSESKIISITMSDIDNSFLRKFLDVRFVNNLYWSFGNSEIYIVRRRVIDINRNEHIVEISKKSKVKRNVRYNHWPSSMSCDSKMSSL